MKTYLKMITARKAFSLIELSIVILIIGIIIAGVTQSSRLVSSYKLSTARSLTRSSDVASISSLLVWFETTSESSFPTSPDNNVALNSDSGHYWQDINPQTTNKNTASHTVGPVYTENCINSLPCLRFNGSTQFLKTTVNMGTSVGLSIFVVFVVDQLTASLQELVITEGAWNISNNSFLYSVSNTGGTNRMYYRKANSTTTLGSVAPTVGSPTITHIIDDGAEVDHYISKSSSSTTTTSASTFKNLDELSIGAWDNAGVVSQYFDGSIGEIIIFGRALKNEERLAVQNYLSKKWNIKIQ